MLNRLFQEINKKISDDEFRFKILLLGSILLFVAIAVFALIINIIYSQKSLLPFSVIMIIFGLTSAVSCHYFVKRIHLIGDIFFIVVTGILIFLPLDATSSSYYLVWPVVYPMWAVLLYQIKKGTIYTFCTLGILVLLFWSPLNNFEIFSGYHPAYGIRVTVAMVSTYILVLLFEVVRISLTEKLKESKERYERLSKFDTLTGIHNRYVFNRRIIKRIEANQDKKEMTLFMMDLDNFKKCNDLGGHFFGDIVLIKVAKIIKSIIKEDDLICRWGGEEFVLISEGISEEESRQKAEEIRGRIEKESFAQEDMSEEIKLTVSIGFVHFIPNARTKAEKIASLADEYMYLAKKKGKNRVEGGTVRV